MNAMVSTHKHRKKVVDRLSRIEGHLRGVKKMVEDDRDCPELLHQIAAIKAAINKVGVLILEDHIESCMVTLSERAQWRTMSRSSRRP